MQSICIPKPLNAFWQSLHIFTLCSAMPSSATVCFVLAAVYCIANILVIRKSTRWSNQMWAGGSSNGRTRIMFKSFWDASVCRSIGAVAAVLFQAFNRFKSLKRCAKYLHIKTPQCILTVFTHLYTLFTELGIAEQSVKMCKDCQNALRGFGMQILCTSF